MYVFVGSTLERVDVTVINAHAKRALVSAGTKGGLDANAQPMVSGPALVQAERTVAPISANESYPRRGPAER